ncbi:MAG: hypothetical protein J3R72DRAFT_196098 [Linnemannia gamsii]|nr:MAG: hypothetical protein J3R72DRAFT_196098 [Linnemannia gamsii]
MRSCPTGTTVLAGLVLSLALSTSFLPTTMSAPPPATSAVPPPPKGNTTATTPISPAPTPAPSLNMPSTFLGVASATGDGQIFFHGGQFNQEHVRYSNELYSLDVTKSWPISNPAWTNLTTITPNGGPTVGGHSATMSTDLKNLYLTAPGGDPAGPFWYKYDTQAKTWAAETAPAT